MNTQQRKVMELALEAVKQSQQIIDEYMTECVTARQANNEAIIAIEEALAQPEQEPVIKTVWVVGGKTWQQICATQEDVHKLIADMGMNTPSLYPSMSEVPLLSYTTPPQRTWVGLTDEEKREIERTICDTPKAGMFALVELIEAKLKEKNT